MNDTCLIRFESLALPKLLGNLITKTSQTINRIS